MLFYWFWYNCCILAMIKQIFNLASKVLYYMFKSILVFILYRYSAHSKYFHASDMSRWINMVYRIVIFLSLPFPLSLLLFKIPLHFAIRKLHFLILTFFCKIHCSLVTWIFYKVLNVWVRKVSITGTKWCGPIKKKNPIKTLSPLHIIQSSIKYIYKENVKKKKWNIQVVHII